MGGESPLGIKWGELETNFEIAQWGDDPLLKDFENQIYDLVSLLEIWFCSFVEGRNEFLTRSLLSGLSLAPQGFVPSGQGFKK